MSAEKPATAEAEEVHLSPLLANVFTSMFSQSEAITNRVMENKDEQIRELQEGYLALFEQLESINEKVDSMRIDRLLGRHAFAADNARRALGAAA